ncbi:MAG: beta-alanine-activating enzyme beta-propeller domain-containing protein, partial [Promethearchaeota archaeon]
CVARDTVFIGTYQGYLYALNFSTGDIKWSYGPISSAFGASPHFVSDQILGDRIYISGDDDWVYCIDIDGSLIWKTHNAEADMHSSVAIDIDRQILCVGSNDYKIYGLNSTTGEVLWSYMTKKEVKPSPVIDSELGYVYCGSWDKNLYCLNIETGAKIWSYMTFGRIFSSVALDLTNNALIFASEDMYIYCLDRETGKKIWSTGMLAPSHSSPSIDINNGVGFIGDYFGNFYSFMVKNGKITSRYKTGARITSSPAIIDNRVLISSCDGYVYCFQSTLQNSLTLPVYGMPFYFAIGFLVHYSIKYIRKLIRRKKKRVSGLESLLRRSSLLEN